MKRVARAMKVCARMKREVCTHIVLKDYSRLEARHDVKEQTTGNGVELEGVAPHRQVVIHQLEGE